MKNNSQRKKVLTNLLQHMEYHNKMAPFPIFDTYYVGILKTKIKMDHMNYDDEPVVACAHCKHLFIVTDEDGNDHCVKCRNSINDTITYSNIYEYLKEHGNLWGIKPKEKNESETGKHKDK